MPLNPWTDPVSGQSFLRDSATGQLSPAPSEMPIDEYTFPPSHLAQFPSDRRNLATGKLPPAPQGVDPSAWAAASSRVERDRRHGISSTFADGSLEDLYQRSVQPMSGGGDRRGLGMGGGSQPPDIANFLSTLTGRGPGGVRSWAEGPAGGQPGGGGLGLNPGGVPNIFRIGSNIYERNPNGQYVRTYLTGSVGSGPPPIEKYPELSLDVARQFLPPQLIANEDANQARGQGGWQGQVGDPRWGVPGQSGAQPGAGGVGGGLSLTPGGGNLDNMSDAELIALAGRMGIDTSGFSTNTMPDPFGGGQGGNITISPEVQAMVSQIYGSQRELGNEDLRREAIERAGARGLNLTDTPINDPYQRSRGLFESQLRSAEAGNLLNMSENRFNAREAGTLSRSRIAEGARQFQSESDRLNTGQRQQFLSNLYNLQNTMAQNAASTRLGLLTNTRPIGPVGTSSTVGNQGFDSTAFLNNLEAARRGAQGLFGASRELFG